MSPEIRIKKPPKFLRKSLLDTIGTILILTLFLLGYLNFPQADPTDYAKEYMYLETTGQLFKTNLPLDSPSLEKVTVTKITDGDTVKALRADNTEIIIRYIGIDTPEIKHQGNGTEEPYGAAATAMNSWLVLNKAVYLLRDATEIDRYGRLLRYVYLDDGAMVNYSLIRLGYASIMTIPPNVAFQQQLFTGQELAKKEGRILYSPSN